MNPANAHPPHPAFIHKTAVGGRIKVSVIDSKTGETVRSYPWQNNLILDSGLDLIMNGTGSGTAWSGQIVYAVVGTGTTPTKDIPDGTYSQSGTTVTRTTGTRDFISGDVGKLIHWSTGEEAKITAFTNATTVTVATSQTVAAASCIIYRVNQTGLTTEVKRTNTYPQFTDADDGNPAYYTTFDVAGAWVKYKVHYDFSEETSDRNYTEIGFSAASGAGNNLFSRILLAGTVTVENGQQLRVKYELKVTMPYAHPTNQQTVEGGITGWPLPYTITGITSTGSNFTVTLSEAHHFVAGGKFNINGAKRPRTTITAATSNSTTLTITATAHGKSVADIIMIEGVTPSGYNGEWTVATVPDANTLTITSAVNPGTGTLFGNLRLKEPGTWYDGEWTIASVTSTTVVITSALNLGLAGPDGTGYNNTKRKHKFSHIGVAQLQVVPGGYGEIPNSGATLNAVYCIGHTDFVTAGNDTQSNRRGFHDGVLPGYLIIPATQPVTLPSDADWPFSWGGTTANYRKIGSASNISCSSPGVGGLASATKKAGTLGSYTNGNFYKDVTFTWPAADANTQDIKFIAWVSGTTTGSGVCFWMQFEEPQRKKSTHKLTLVIRRIVNRDLTIEAS